jgi:hypothetical protein
VVLEDGMANLKIVDSEDKSAKEGEKGGGWKWLCEFGCRGVR